MDPMRVGQFLSRYRWHCIVMYLPPIDRVMDRRRIYDHPSPTIRVEKTFAYVGINDPRTDRMIFIEELPPTPKPQVVIDNSQRDELRKAQIRIRELEQQLLELRTPPPSKLDTVVEIAARMRREGK